MTTQGNYLNFGAGDPVPGWLNLDPSPFFMLPRAAHHALLALRLSDRSSRYLCADYRYFRFSPGRAIPIETNSVAAIYCSHVLEHLPASAVPPLIEEFRRIVRPGGTVRIIVPDLAAIADHAFRMDGPFIALDEKLGTLPRTVADSRLRSIVEGAFGFPSLHRTAISVEALTASLGSCWLVRPNLGYLDSEIAAERLAEVEEADRFEQALAFELRKQAS